jgi:hypothetical protein
MKGDFTKVTFRPRAHFSGVRLQQGRVGLDADWNEQVDIAAHRDETTARDVIGHCGGPIGDAGFEISVAGSDLDIGAGRYYAGGVLCENEDGTTFGTQPDLPGAELPTAAGTYLAYLDVWTRHVTAIEDRSLREVALGGADTATRTRTVWQVKLAGVDPGDTCLDFGPDWTPPGAASTGRLRAQSTPVPLELNECVVPPGSGYRRLENQLYRVEIHDPSGSGGPTYKWSRDNGTVAARLESIEDLVLTVSDPGRDTVLGFAAGQTIELSDEGRVLRGQQGVLVELDEVNGNELTITSWPAGPMTMDDFGDIPTVRRWDSPGAIDVDAGDLVELEDGVEIEFSTGTLRTGDYWLIPARTLIGDVEWPRNGSGPELQKRHGIEHHYCPLALLTLAGDGETWSVDSDCRELFPPLTELTSLYYVGGDGQEAMPDPTQPGDLVQLAQPIEVGVANGQWPVEGATVLFEIVDGNGTLNGSTAPIEVSTGANGIAAATWHIDSTTHVQRATATLIDAEDAPHHLQIHFTANLSEASHVAYDPGTCSGLAGSVTVQSAIDTVSSLAHLYYVGGDGQEGLPGAELSPLAVLVANDCGAIEGATVRFEVQSGNGSLNGGGTSADVTTDGSGLAQCTWQLGTTDHRQQVLASLVDAPDVPLGLPGVAMFNANLSVAAEVAYDPSKCPNLSGADTVQEAIDLLCTSKDGAEEGIQIERITLLSGSILLNDSDVALEELARGIRITCDRELDQSSVRFKPVVVVQLEMPWPMTDDDAGTWGGFRVGFVPLKLSAQTNSDNNEIFWVPTPQTSGWLADVLPQRLGELELKQLLARLTVMGNFIWESENPRVWVDGDVFGRPRDGATDIRLPSGDRRRGGDLRMWFRLRPG